MQTTVEILREDLPRTAERGTAETLQGNTAPLNHANYLTNLQGLDAVRPCEPTGTRPQSEMVPGGLAAWFGMGRDAAGAGCGRSPARRDDGRRPPPRPLADDALEWRFCIASQVGRDSISSFQAEGPSARVIGGFGRSPI
jgi:hypothetical protein